MVTPTQSGDGIFPNRSQHSKSVYDRPRCRSSTMSHITFNRYITFLPVDDTGNNKKIVTILLRLQKKFT